MWNSGDLPLVTAPDNMNLPAASPPPGLDLLAAAAAHLTALADVTALALPAFGPEGDPIIPPDEHVLDFYARAYDLADEDVVALCPAALTVAVMWVLPGCDTCSDPIARYDAVSRVHGATGFLCISCFRTHGGAVLGSGRGQYLLATAEVPARVRARVDQLLVEHDRQPMDWAGPLPPTPNG